MIEAPLTMTLLRIEGTREKPVRDMVLRGLTFDLTNVSLGASGWGALGFDGAVSVKQADDCRLIGLTVLRAGGQGISIKNTSDTIVKNCHVHHTGACGILYGTGERNRLENNEVHDVGLVYPSGIGICANCLKHSRISHNDVHDCTYCGIALGNRMTDQTPACNIIEYNRVRNVMNSLDDGGCVYLYGRERFTRVIGNVLKDSSALQRWTVGLYLDELVEDITCEGNVIIRPGYFPLHMNITQDCTIRNNLFVCGPGKLLTFGEGCRFQRNIIYGPETGINFRVASSARIADNLYFAGEMPVFPIGVVWRGIRAFPKGFLAEAPRFDTIMVDGGHSGPTKTSADGSRSLGAATLIRTPVGDFPDEASWENALTLPDMVGPTGKPDPGISTDSRLLTDGRRLYLRVTCLGGDKKVDQSATVIWQRDHVELFLKPNVRQEGALQIGLARDGDMKVVNPLENSEHKVSWAHRMEEVPKGWRAMLNVPLEEVTALLNLDATAEWGILVGRADNRREKFGIGDIVADPGFVAPEKGDFRFQPDSPAIALGIKPFDTKKAGRISHETK